MVSILAEINPFFYTNHYLRVLWLDVAILHGAPSRRRREKTQLVSKLFHHGNKVKGDARRTTARRPRLCARRGPGSEKRYLANHVVS